MIEKVEVVRGGGSALYGSNAIAGTINIILKDPNKNSYEGGANYSLIGIGVDGSGDEASDYSDNFNTSIVSDDHKSGVSLYGFTRKRGMFDANDDDFSEIAPLNNLTFGARVFIVLVIVINWLLISLQLVKKEMEVICMIILYMKEILLRL